MKLLLILVILPFYLSSQLKIEWLKEVEQESTVAGLFYENAALRVATASGIYSYNFFGKQLKHSPVPSGVVGMGRINNGLFYTAGANDLTFFDQSLTKTIGIP